MDRTILRIALKLASKGVSEDTIEEALGLGAEQPATKAAAREVPPAPRSAKREVPKPGPTYQPREENYDQLIDAIATTVAAKGAVEGTLRAICEEHRTAWLACLPNERLKPTVRGFSGVVVGAVDRGGILRGILRVTALGRSKSPAGRDAHVYRFEAA